AGVSPAPRHHGDGARTSGAALQFRRRDPRARLGGAAAARGHGVWRGAPMIPCDADVSGSGLGGPVPEGGSRLPPGGPPHVRSVAEVVRLSARTLQRRLAEEGVTFAAVVARARFDAARRMLEDPSRKVVDVALDVGYSDHAHFTRAFVRWTGVSPREFRRRGHDDRSMSRRE